MRALARALTWTGAAISAVVALWLLVHHPTTRITLFGLGTEAVAPLDDGGRVSVQIAGDLGLCFRDCTVQRRISRCGGSSWSLCRSKWLIPVAGSRGHWINLYARADGSHVAADSFWMIDLPPRGAPRLFRWDEEVEARLPGAEPDCGAASAPHPMPPSAYFRDLTFVGAFDLVLDGLHGAEFEFIPSAQRAEVLCGWPSRG